MHACGQIMSAHGSALFDQHTREGVWEAETMTTVAVTDRLRVMG